jgi:hypothetical protein
MVTPQERSCTVYQLYFKFHKKYLQQPWVLAEIECSFCRLIRRPEHLIERHWYRWQSEGHSFGDHMISLSVIVTPSSVIEASIVLCSVSLWLVWVSVKTHQHDLNSFEVDVYENFWCTSREWKWPEPPFHYFYLKQNRLLTRGREFEKMLSVWATVVADIHSNLNLAPQRERQDGEEIWKGDRPRCVFVSLLPVAIKSPRSTTLIQAPSGSEFSPAIRLATSYIRATFWPEWVFSLIAPQICNLLCCDVTLRHILCNHISLYLH